MPVHALQILAPRNVIGWIWRLPILMVFGFGFWVGVALLLPGAVGGLALPVLAVVLVFSLALLGAVAHAARVERRLMQVRTRDPVTGLPNRTQFLALTTRALPQSGVLLFLDIDHFKALNDRRGRRAGDLCLMALAQRFRELTRKTDILGRLDGAVFAIYLPGAPVEVARELGDRLSQGLEILTGGGIVRVTVSAGAVLADGCTPLEQLLRDADRALERAKLQGRARMILAELPAAA